MTSQELFTPSRSLAKQKRHFGGEENSHERHRSIPSQQRRTIDPLFGYSDKKIARARKHLVLLIIQVLFISIGNSRGLLEESLAAVVDKIDNSSDRYHIP